MSELPAKLTDTPYTRDLWTQLAEKKYVLTTPVLKNRLADVEGYITNGLLSFRTPSDETDKILRTSLPRRLCSFVTNLKVLAGLDALQAYDILCHYLQHEFRGTQDILQFLFHNEDKISVLTVDIWEFYRSERLFLLKSINLLLCPEKLVQKDVIWDFINKSPNTEFINRMIDQYESLLDEELPVSLSHGPLMTKKVQSKWFETHLREQIEVLHNLILSVDHWGVCCSHLERILGACYKCQFGKKYFMLLKEEDIVAKEFTLIIGYLLNVLLLSCFNLSKRIDRLQWTDILSGCKEDLIGSFEGGTLESPVVFIWTTMKTVTYPEDCNLHTQDKLADLAVNSRVFEYFERLLKSHIFKDVNTKLSIITYTGVNDLLCLMIHTFDKRDLSEVPGFMNLIGPVFRHPMNCNALWDPANFTQRALLLIVLERFSLEYGPFIRAACSLVKNGKDHVTELNVMITRMNEFTEEWDPVLRLMPRKAPRVVSRSIDSQSESQYSQYSEYSEYSEYSDSVESRGIFGLRTRSVSSAGSGNEFNVFKSVFHEHDMFASKVLRGEQFGVKYIDNILASLRFVKLWIKFDGHEITEEELKVVEQIFYVMSCLRNSTTVPTKVLGCCMDIVSVLLNPDCLRIMDSDELRIISSVRTLKILPFQRSIPKDLSQIGYTEHFCSGIIGQLVSLQEITDCSYELLIDYLSFVYKLLKIRPNVEDSISEYMVFILPGVVYIIEEIFPRYHNWVYKNERDQDRITLKCISIFHEIFSLHYAKGMTLALEMDPEVSELRVCYDQQRIRDQSQPRILNPLVLVQKIIVYHMLHMDVCSQLIRIIVAGDTAIQLSMEKRMHWFSKRHSMMVFCIRLAMSILNRLFIIRGIVEEETTTSRLDCELITRPSFHSEHVKVIPMIVTYLNNSFCKYLPIMALALLTTFAEKYPRTLLPCMEMEPHVIRELFASKLYSQLETSSLKESLLFLIGACCEHQPGMCQALFNIHPEKNKTGPEEETGGCLLFLCDILKDVQEGRRGLTDILYSPTVECVVTIWTGFAADVAEYLRKRKGFWSAFCSPLLNVPRIFTSSISQIITIISQEVFYYRGDIPNELTEVLKRFFDGDMGTVAEWFGFLLGVLKKEVPCRITRIGKRPLEKMPLDLQFLLSMKRFLFICGKYLPFNIANKQMAAVGDHLMNALLYSLFHPERTGLKLLAEMYLFIIQNIDTVPIEREQHWVSRFESILVQFSIKYAVISPQERAVILAVLVKEMAYVSNSLKSGPAAESILNSTKEIIYLEVNYIMAYGCIQSEESRSLIHLHTRSAKLAMCLIHKLLCICEDCILQFRDRDFAPMIIFFFASFGELMKTKHDKSKITASRLEIAEHIVNILLLFSKYGIMEHYLIDQVQTHMFLQLLPPPQLDPTLWLNSEWVVIYRLALELITHFVSAYGSHVVPQVVSFVSMHTEYLTMAILAIRFTFKMEVLKLSLAALNLMRELVKYSANWRSQDLKSLECMCFAVSSCLGTASVFLSNPTMLRKWTDRHQSAAKKDALLHEICNQLLKLSYISLAIIQEYTPRLLPLTTGADVDQWVPILELNFNSPMLGPETQGLTFGALISLAHFCMQAITKTIRISSPGVLLRSARMGIGLGSSMELAMDRHFTCKVFEMSLELIASQALLYLLGTRLPDHEKPSLQKTLNTEMTFLWVYVERIYCQKAVPDMSDNDELYLTAKKYLPFLMPTRSKIMYQSKPTLVFQKSSGISEPGPSTQPIQKKDSQKAEEEAMERYTIYLAKIFYRIVVSKAYCKGTE